MKVGDLVVYRGSTVRLGPCGFKALIVGISQSNSPNYITLYFLNPAPDWLRQANDGFYHGFKSWQLELLSEA
jgi:hypothetical protein